MSRTRSWAVAAVLALCVGTIQGAAKTYDVCDYGAAADGKTLCTQEIQKAIDACNKAGGGKVYFPAGRFLSGTLVLRSNVTLHLDAGSVLLGSTDLKDYPSKVQAFRSYTDNYTEKSLIYAEKAERIAIEGRGTIDGQGKAFKGPYKVRPYMIRIIECRDVAVEDVTIINSPMWVQHYLACEDVRIDGITVRSLVNRNNDGIDIDCCRRVVISNCNILSSDDAIVLKSTADRVCRDVVVSNCVLSTQCNALKMGTESNGGFKNIVLSNCTIYDTRLAGVALDIVDGGTMDGIVVSNITMDGVGAPIFVRLGNRARPFKKDGPEPGIGVLRNVTISNIEASGGNIKGSSITGQPEAKVENVTLANIRLGYAGGGSKDDCTKVVPEKADSYPEYNMFGKLPAYGLYCRHVRGLRLVNVEMQTDKDDLRHAVVFDDVQDAVVDGLQSPFAAGAGAVLKSANVRDVLVRGCRPVAGTEVFLRLEGQASTAVVLSGNDMSAVRTMVEFGDGVSKGAVAPIANRMR